VVARGDAQILSCSVRVSVDPNDIQKRIQQVQADKSLRQTDLRRQQGRIGELESRLETLTKSLGQASGKNAAAIWLERSEVVSDIRSIEAATRSWQERTERNKALQLFIKERIKDGMTEREVLAILGEPTKWVQLQHQNGEVWWHGDARDAAPIIFDARGFVREINNRCWTRGSGRCSRRPGDKPPRS
jgi:predicted nuclease with TOPRIM domain